MDARELAVGEHFAEVRVRAGPGLTIEGVAPSSAAPSNREAMTSVGRRGVIVRLFGTDGIRGKAGDPPLDPSTVARVGAALARTLAGSHQGRAVRVLLGRDTRESGEWIERELTRRDLRRGRQWSSARASLPTPGWHI